MTDSPEELPAHHPHGEGVADAGGPAVLAALGVDVAGTLLERLGIEVTAATEERVSGTMPVAGNTQPFGLLHGGASAAMAETLASVGAALHAAASGHLAVGVDLNVTHHRGVRGGTVTGVAEALSLGGTIASYAVTLRDDDGNLVCSGRVTCLLVARARPGAQAPSEVPG